MQTELKVSILGVQFDVLSENAAVLEYTKYFMSYGPGSGFPIQTVIPVTIREGKARHETAEIHRSRVHLTKHANWDFEAVSHTAPNYFTWPDKGLCMHFLKEGDRTTGIEVTTDSEHISVPIIGEAVFHLFRSMAYYLRNPVEGLLLHASAVKNKDNHGILFTGNSLSGKTTALLTAVLDAGSVPLANDRILLTSTDTNVTRGYSWPSYASFCEGTLLRYPELTKASYAFEHAGNPFRTHAKEEQLKAEFSKTCKRIYPMGWFAEAVNTTYSLSAPIKRIIFTEITPNSSYRFEQMQAPELTEVYELLVANSFLNDEPSFLAWHGLEKPGDRFALETLQNWLTNGIEFWKLNIAPDALPGKIEHILN